MKEQKGHLDYIKVELQPTSLKLMKMIAKQRDLELSYVKKVLSYNVIPVKSLNAITGVTVSTIHVKFRPYDSKRLGKQVYPLLKCIPFPDLHEIFVLRNDECNLLIKKKNGYKDLKSSKKAAT